MRSLDICGGLVDGGIVWDCVRGQGHRFHAAGEALEGSAAEQDVRTARRVIWLLRAREGYGKRTHAGLAVRTLCSRGFASVSQTAPCMFPGALTHQEPTAAARSAGHHNITHWHQGHRLQGQTN